jgi:thermostable 8-oxoguanine DNA glycosylase
MVNLNKEIDFDRNDYDLEEFMIFCIMVAGKKATTMARLLDNILSQMHAEVDPQRELKPFGLIDRWINCNPSKDLGEYLKNNGVGCYNHRAKAIICLIDAALDLRTCTIEDLEELYGVGQKTSRFFLMCNRPDIKAAILDRHILRYLNELGHNVPLNTPTSKSDYNRIERIFLQEAENNNIDPMEFDYGIWKKAAGVE